jgi:hypothetical protein
MPRMLGLLVIAMPVALNRTYRRQSERWSYNKSACQNADTEIVEDRAQYRPDFDLDSMT